MDLQITKYTVGQVVYAKLKGYPPWPAVITKIVRDGIATVPYFNSTKWNDLSFKKLTPYHAEIMIEKRYLEKNKGFTKAFNEMHFLLGYQKKNEQKRSLEPRVGLQRLTAEDVQQICPNSSLTTAQRYISTQS